MQSLGKLYVIATPIGNLKDITFRALETLRSVDLIAAEDTRHSQKLLQHFTITLPCISLHQHNEQQRAQQLLAHLQQGRSIALISDAGTPLISDPGAKLLQYLYQYNVPIIPIPGPSALIAALSVAGFPAEQFVFAGFLPAQKSARLKQLQRYREETRTWVIYEAPHRIADLLADMASILGKERLIVIAKELTKQFETIYRATIGQAIDWLELDAHHAKGEFVIVVSGNAPETHQAVPDEAKRLLKLLLSELPLKRAAALTARFTGVSKNALYQLGLTDPLD